MDWTKILKVTNNEVAGETKEETDFHEEVDKKCNEALSNINDIIGAYFVGQEPDEKLRALGDVLFDRTNRRA